MKEKNWVKTVLSFASQCRGKITLSVLCACISVGAGLVPYLCVYRIITMFIDGTAEWQDVMPAVIMKRIFPDWSYSIDQESDIRQFIGEIRKYESITELDEGILNHLIDRILINPVSQVRNSDKKLRYFVQKRDKFHFPSTRTR